MTAAGINLPTLASMAASHRRESLKEAHKLQPSPVLASLWFLAAGAMSVGSCIFFIQVIDVPSTHWGISKSFLGLVVLPVTLSAVESVAAIWCAKRKETNWTIHATLISNIQLSLYVLPITVCVGWIMDVKGMNLYFDGFQIALVFLTVVLINQLFQGKRWRW